MANFNRCILAGNLTRDPELKYLPSGSALCNFSLALNRLWSTETGEKREEVCFVDVTAFGKQGEVIAQYLRKGDPILVEGRLKTDSWDDKQTGQKRSKLGVVLESFSFMGGDKKADGQRPAPQKPVGRPAPNSPPGNGKEPEDDDVPF